MSTPRVLVLQPILPPRAPVDTRVLGIQKWLVEELSALGCETVSTLAKSDLAPELAALPHPSDSMLLGLLRRSGSSHGVVLSFAVEDARPHLTAARLVEAPLRGPLRDVGRWSLDADADHLPSVAHSLLAAITGALGREARGKTWQESFGVGTREAADNYLTALGCLAAIADGSRAQRPRGRFRRPCGRSAGRTSAVARSTDLPNSCDGSSRSSTSGAQTSGCSRPR